MAEDLRDGGMIKEDSSVEGTFELRSARCIRARNSNYLMDIPNYLMKQMFEILWSYLNICILFSIGNVLLGNCLVLILLL